MIRSKVRRVFVTAGELEIVFGWSLECFVLISVKCWTHNEACVAQQSRGRWSSAAHFTSDRSRDTSEESWGREVIARVQAFEGPRISAVEKMVRTRTWCRERRRHHTAPPSASSSEMVAGLCYFVKLFFFSLLSWFIFFLFLWRVCGYVFLFDVDIMGTCGRLMMTFSPRHVT